MGILNVTPDSFSDGGRFIDPAKAIAHACDMAEQGADILDIGAESTRPYGGAQPIRPTRNWRGLSRCCRRWSSSACRSRSTPSRRRSPPGRSTRARPSSTMSGACSAIPIWRRSSPNVACRSSSCTIARPPTPAIDIMADIERVLRPLAGDRRARRHCARADRARSRHRLRQDAGAEHRLHRAARRAQALRPAAPGRRLAQALHQFGDAGAARRTHRRLDCRRI